MPTDPTATTQPEDEGATAGRSVVGARYELISLLGAGGMGNVYRARDVELDEIVALKLLRPEVAGAPGALDRFRREVKLARRVTHPNVARVFDIGEHGGEKILTMELIDGESLSALLEREGALSVARTIEIACAVCAGVGAAHAAGVVHRDLKPDNVMLGKDGRVVVTDFGIARAAAPNEASKTLGGFVGTPVYMAPEQVEATTVDERADIYAFGAMLYEMLTGTYAWKGESAIAVAAARLVNPPPDPRAARPDISTRMAEVVLRCLARRPEERYAKMSDISAVLATITASAAAPSIPPPPRAEPGLSHADSDKRVAVLPFRNLGAAEHDYVADGLTDNLIDLLSVARGLRVHSRGVVMRFKDLERDARDVGRELDVQVVVDGSVRKTPGAFRISARLISVADGLQLWAKRFDGVEADMLAVNDEVARSVAEALAVELATGQARVADAEAADLYMRARLTYHRLYSASDTEAAALFAMALSRAPDDPRILAGYVMARARVATDAATRAAIREQADRAVRLAPSLPDAHAALGAVLLHALDEVGAVRSLRRALRLASNNAEVHDLLGRVLEEVDVPEAVRHLEAAIALEPATVLARVNLIRHHGLAGDWERVESMFDTTELPARMLTPHRARVMMWRRDVDGAAKLLPTLDDSSLPSRGAKVMLNILLGREAQFTTPPGAGPRLVCFYAQLRAEGAALASDPVAALDAIESATAGGLYDIRWLDRCPLLELVRADPRFTRLRVTVAERAAAVRAAYTAKDL